MGCEHCFFNAPGYFEDTSYSRFPSPQEAEGKIVRVNDGHDANLGGMVRTVDGSDDWMRSPCPTELLWKGNPAHYTRDELVKIVDAAYRRKFWNTSLPRFDFPGPVVFTCNGREALAVPCPPNVMAVRIRFNSWDLLEATALAEWYDAQNVPVLLTAMRYSKETAIPKAHRHEYAHKKHVLNSYWTLDRAVEFQIKDAVQGVCDHVGTVRLCGEGKSLCRDCGNCALLFSMCKARMQEDS